MPQLLSTARIRNIGEVHDMRHRPWYSNERYVAEKKLSLTTFESDQVEGSTRHMAGGGSITMVSTVGNLLITVM